MTPHARPIVVSLFCLSLGACAFTPHDVSVQPTTTIAPSTVGTGTTVYFRFVDDRDDTSVGFRGAAGQGSTISAQSLPTTVESQLKQGMEKKSYALAASEQGSDGTVTFRMRSFKFAVETGFWAGSDNVSAVLAVDALRSGRTYSNVYRFNSQHTAMVVPAGTDIDAMMNAALSDILQQALSDSALDQFLTHKG